MTRYNSLKINSLIKDIPRGLVLTSHWLKKQGISSKLAWWYVQSGWFERVADGAYKLAGDSVTWASALQALQEQCHLPVHVGGKTALQLLGKSHYVSAELTELQLFTSAVMKLPRWLHSNAFKETFKLYATPLFAGIDNVNSGLLSREYNNLQIQLSSPERAALEVCYLVPKAVSFEEASLLIENLSRLRPELVQSLLEACQSIRAKRLFLHLSEYHQHDWLKELNLEKVDLGKGKQVIAGGGVYNAKYKISVPNMGGSSE